MESPHNQTLSPSSRMISLTFEEFMKMKDLSPKSRDSPKNHHESSLGFGRFYEVSKEGRKYSLKKLFKTEPSSEEICIPLRDNSQLNLSILDDEFPDLEELIWKGKTKTLDNTLEAFRIKNGGKFNLKTVILIGIQGVQQIQKVNEKRLIHRDIRAGNFVLDLSAGPPQMIHLINSGFCTLYMDENEVHSPFKENIKYKGDPLYMSLFGHLKIRSTRRDDLISLGYMLLDLFFGVLPWSGIDATTTDGLQQIFRTKIKTPLEVLCKGLPEGFILYFKYVCKLSFIMKPDYQYLITLFRKILVEKGFDEDDGFDFLGKPTQAGINLKINRMNLEPLIKYKKD